MTPDDPRHGQRAGYIAGCRNECCRVPHLRYQKRSSLRRLREGSQYVPPGRTLNRLAWWASHGVTPRGLAMGAGISESILQGIIREGFRPTKETERRTLAVIWDDLPDTALVNADITRARIYSLMAAGHPLIWICEHTPGLNVGGKWRDQPRVTLGLARAVQKLYDSAPIAGSSKGTAAKAQRRGHQPPAAWDDPRTPAMPSGWKPAVDKGSDRRARTDVDEAVVLRLLSGERLLCTSAERNAAMTRWKAAGHSERELCLRQGWKDSRYGRKDAA